ncbi:MAG: Gfo/Idh/MocA family protein, partial [Ruminiclostridium sp.]
GWSWIDIVLKSTHWELTAIVDLNAKLLEDAREHYNIDSKKTFTTLADALKNVEADAALVVVPPNFHKPVAIEAMEAGGLDCIVEKPLSATVSDARAIVECAKKCNRKLMVSQNYRFKRASQTVKSVIKRGLIGEIGSVYVNFQKAPPFTGFRTEMEEPLIVDMAVHHFDQVRGILGLEPVSVTAHSWNPKWSWFKGNAVSSVLFEMSNGAVVSYTGSWVSRGWETTWDGDWRIQGDDGEIRWANNEVVVKTPDIMKSVFQDGALETNGQIKMDLLSLPCEERLGSLSELASAIHENREPETSGLDNLKSMAMVLGAVQSAKTGKTILIEDVLIG